jgi:cysteine desulfurase / selenocysteine lyase
VNPSAFARVRAREYPWAERSVYMNAAAFGPLPDRARRAVDAFNARRHEAPLLGDAEFPEILGRARAAVARLLNAPPATIALTTNTSHGLNLAAAMAVQRVAAGGARTVLISDREFPANVYPWLAAERHGLRLERLPADELGRPREALLLERLERGDVGVCAVSAVQFASGYRAGLEAIGRVCAERGILFVVDAIQALGAVPLDVRACRIDVLASGGQKWLCAPFGTGFVYVREELLGFEPEFPGWLSFSACLDFASLLAYRWELLEDGRRFEVGTLPVQDMLGLAEAVELLLELDVAAIHAHILAVQEPIVAWARQQDDVAIVSDTAPERRSGILCLHVPAQERVHALLAEHGVRCVIREGALRLSPHFYNTVAEGQGVAELLAEAVAACAASTR